MATRRRKRRRNAPARRATRVANPRRRRRSVRRRRHNPVVARRRNARRAIATNPRHRRRHSRRRSNPSGMRIGEIFKDMVYGAGGAILTRVGAGAVRGLIPASFASAPYTEAAVQAGIAVVGVRYLGGKFLGPKQGDIMMLGGLISAGLALADAYLPNVQQSLAGIIRLPNGIIAAQPAQLIGPPVTPVTGSGLGDVYDVDMVAAGFGDVEEIPAGMWS